VPRNGRSFVICLIKKNAVP